MKLLGNRIGWIVSIVLLVLESYVVYLLVHIATDLPKPSKGIVYALAALELNLPSNPQMLDEIKLPIDILEFVPSMTRDEDCGAMIKEATIEFRNDATLGYGYYRRSVADDLKNYKTKRPALAKLAEARTMKRMTLLSDRPEKFIDAQIRRWMIDEPSTTFLAHLTQQFRYPYHPTTTISDDLDLSGKPPERYQHTYTDPTSLTGAVLENIAGCFNDMALDNSNKPQARELCEALISLGYKMAQERVRWYELRAGIELMRIGLGMLGSYVDPANQEKYYAKAEELKNFRNRSLAPLAAILETRDPNVIKLTLGDVFYIIQNSKGQGRERLWRVEAVLRLGYLRLYTEHAPSKREADRLLNQIMADKTEHPHVQLAAKVAKNMKALDVEKRFWNEATQ